MITVLVVEDEQSWREGLTRFYSELLGKAATVMSVPTGEEAISALKATSITLISTDILLKGSGVADGRRVLREAKSCRCRAAIVVTAMALDEEIEGVLDDGSLARVTFPTFLQGLFPGANLHFPKPSRSTDPLATLAQMRKIVTRERLMSLVGLEFAFVLEARRWRIAFDGECTTLDVGVSDYLHAVRLLLSRHGAQIPCDELELAIPGRSDVQHGELFETALPGRWRRESVRAAEDELAAAQAANDAERVRVAYEVLRECRPGVRQTHEGGRVSDRVSRGVRRAIGRIEQAGGTKAAKYLKERIKTGSRLWYPKGDGVRWRTE